MTHDERAEALWKAVLARHIKPETGAFEGANIRYYIASVIRDAETAMKERCAALAADEGLDFVARCIRNLE
jgi:hypothetical protein